MNASTPRYGDFSPQGLTPAFDRLLSHTGDLHPCTAIFSAHPMIYGHVSSDDYAQHNIYLVAVSS